MANVYSVRHLEFPQGTHAGSRFAIVPAGFVWVLRSIQLTDSGSPPGRDGSSFVVFGESGSDSFTIFQINGTESVFNRTYTWQGWCVLNPGDVLIMAADGGNWSGSASGHKLTLP